LLRSVIGSLDALLAPQSAVAAAVTLAPPLPRDGQAVCVATLGLLRTSGQRQPVPVVTDDFQWLDGVSQECVLRAARRAPGAVAFALAMREAEGGDRTAEGLLALRPGRLGRKNSLQVLSCVAADLAMSVAGARVNAAAGNLLALIGLPAPLSREQRAGWARLGRPPTPGAAAPTVRPPGQRAAWLSAARAGGCNLRGRRPDYDLRSMGPCWYRCRTFRLCQGARAGADRRRAPGVRASADPRCCIQRRQRRDAHCAVAGLRSPRTLMTCHDRSQHHNPVCGAR